MKCIFLENSYDVVILRLVPDTIACVSPETENVNLVPKKNINVLLRNQNLTAAVVVVRHF